MTNDRIKLRPDQAAATECAELQQWIMDVRSVYERGVRIRAKMRHSFDDGGGAEAIDWTAVETIWGVTAGVTSTGPTSNGALVFTFVDGAVGSMDGTFQTSAAKDVTERVG